MSGARVSRPAVILDPGRQFGAPRLDGTRVAAVRAADACWAGFTAAQAADQLGLDRRQVLVACWFVTRWAPNDHQRQLWRRRWKGWADENARLFDLDQWHRIPDPPSPNRPPDDGDPEPVEPVPPAFPPFAAGGIISADAAPVVGERLRAGEVVVPLAAL